MDIFQAIILALVQGLTEFLPISSSAHLILVPILTGWQDQGLAFDVAVHFGTLAAVVAYFRAELSAMARSWFSSLATRNPDDEAMLAWAVLLGTIPAWAEWSVVSRPDRNLLAFAAGDCHNHHRIWSAALVCRQDGPADAL